MSRDIARVAIVTRTKDRALTLRRTMGSIAAQTLKDIEWIVVNDGGTREPVEEIAAQARALGIAAQVVHRTESGRWKAANTGLAEARADYIVLLDDDDTWEPDFLRLAVEFLDRHAAFGGVAAWTRIINERIEGECIEQLGTELFNDWMTSVYLIDMTRRNLFPPHSFVFRRAALDTIGTYDDSLPVMADWDFHLRFLERFDIGVIPQPLANWHLRTSSKGEFGNTVLAGGDQHVLYDALIRNRMLRRDLREGRIGLGVLVSLGRRHNQTMGVLTQVDGVLGKLSRMVQKTGLRQVLRRISG